MPASTRTSTTEFLRFHSPRVCDQKRPIICHKLFLQLDRAECVNIFRIVCYHSLGDRLADRIYLRGVSTALDAHADVDIGKGIFASDENGLVDFESQNLRLNKVDGRPVDTEQAFSLTRMRDGSRGLAWGGKFNNQVCRNIPARRTFFFPNVCTALVEDAIL